MNEGYGFCDECYFLEKEVKRLEKRVKELKECLEEAINLVEDARTGDYEIDSFTTQPWKTTLEK